MPLEIVAPDVTEIQEAVRVAVGCLHETAARIEHTITKVIVAGRMLMAKREQVEHGEWMAWIEKNVTEPLDVTYATTRNWIKLAEFMEKKEAQLEDAATVRQAYILAGLLKEPESSSGGSGKDAGNYLVHISRLERAIRSQIDARPIAKWSQQDRAILRQRLAPLVQIFEELDAA
jgi:hypothetical protein